MDRTKPVSERILIAGSGGQLAQAFIGRFEASGQAFAAPTEREFDITNADAVAAALAAHHPQIVINCAAYNAVDAAETDEATAHKINADAVRTLVEQCEATGCRLVHFSSDYVFDGKTSVPYTEEDTPAPLNAYGRSKLAGEQAALESATSLVLRVSWVFGNGTQNFLYKLRQWAAGNDSLKITSDEVSVPCYTEDIVTTTMKAIQRDITGLHHASSSGHASRVEFAELYLGHVAPDVSVIPVPMSTFELAAERPHFSAMDNRGLSGLLSSEIPDWRSGVERFVEAS